MDLDDHQFWGTRADNDSVSYLELLVCACAKTKGMDTFLKVWYVLTHVIFTIPDKHSHVGMPGQLITELDSNIFPLSTLNPVKVLIDVFQKYFFIHIGYMWNFETQAFFSFHKAYMIGLFHNYSYSKLGPTCWWEN